jgi:hypothetical protein
VIYASTNGTVNASLVYGTSGLAGTIGVRIITASSTTPMARTTSGIVEYPASSGIYFATINLGTVNPPLDPGRYWVMWDDGSSTPGHVITEDLILHRTSTLSQTLRALGAAQADNNVINDHPSVAVIVG